MSVFAGCVSQSHLVRLPKNNSFASESLYVCAQRGIANVVSVFRNTISNNQFQASNLLILSGSLSTSHRTNNGNDSSPRDWSSDHPVSPLPNISRYGPSGDDFLGMGARLRCEGSSISVTEATTRCRWTPQFDQTKSQPLYVATHSIDVVPKRYHLGQPIENLQSQ